MELLAKPVMAVLYADWNLLEVFLSELPVEDLSEPFYFQSLQGYYSREMGEGLHKVFLSLKGLIRREDLVKFKLWTVEKERLYSCEGKRRLNIDPGYVDESHLVLASSKRRGGRLYLGMGVFGEMEYLYVYGGFRPLYWTYTDYRNRQVRDFFERVRDRFLEQLNLARKGKELIVYRFLKDELYEEVQTWGPVGEVKVQS
ncbi:MAG: DUF4416 family protein [Aquificaceae bacterium]|nr:DUF4416 family protein [Aquificaceae bacterium]MDW8424110.1 DUF4416 family protein [Aquificaceae bacterium]